MFNLQRTITSWRSLAVLAGLLTVMATNVATASPRHGRRVQLPPVPKQVPQQCAVCLKIGPQKCSVHAQGLGLKKKMYQRGFAAGKRAGWQAGYTAGLKGSGFGGRSKQRLGQRSLPFKAGFKSGYAQAYQQGYRQGRAESRPRPRGGLGRTWHWSLNW